MTRKTAQRLWRSITRHLPHIAREVKLQALICSRHGKEATPENLRWAEAEMDRAEANAT